ncbi:ribonuclease H-like domain-containing protein, partial [Tanacetum coccineum]
MQASETTSKTPNPSPNDDEEGTSGSRDESVHQPVFGSDSDHSIHDEQIHQPSLDIVTHQPGHDEQHSATPIEGKIKHGLNRYANHYVLSAENCCFISNLNKSSEPSSYEEASKDINWINAMNDEMRVLYENDIWDVTDLPIGRKPIRSKWVFKIKYKSTGEIERFKARLVAKGFNQKEGIDYEETFSLVVKMGNFKWDVYMLPPRGFFKEGKTGF